VPSEGVSRGSYTLAWCGVGGGLVVTAFAMSEEVVLYPSDDLEMEEDADITPRLKSIVRRAPPDPPHVWERKLEGLKTKVRQLEAENELLRDEGPEGREPPFSEGKKSGSLLKGAGKASAGAENGTCSDSKSMYEKLKSSFEKDSGQMKITLLNSFYTYKINNTDNIQKQINEKEFLAHRIKGLGEELVTR